VASRAHRDNPRIARAPRIPRIAVHHGGPIVGIDVETACPEHGAVCSIGVSVVAAGSVVREKHWYLDPGTRFDPRFIAIHGITPAMVSGSPRLSEAWPELLRFVEDGVDAARPPRLLERSVVPDPDPLHVAHNAQFDRLQIERALRSPLPFRLACTVSMSRRAFPQLERHNLKTVSSHLRIPLKHHDALSDARACALIAHRCIAAGAGS
jgi:DNA polymerase III subunit epsilon